MHVMRSCFVNHPRSVRQGSWWCGAQEPQSCPSSLGAATAYIVAAGKALLGGGRSTRLQGRVNRPALLLIGSGGGGGTPPVRAAQAPACPACRQRPAAPLHRIQRPRPVAIAGRSGGSCADPELGCPALAMQGTPTARQTRFSGSLWITNRRTRLAGGPRKLAGVRVVRRACKRALPALPAREPCLLQTYARPTKRERARDAADTNHGCRGRQEGRAEPCRPEQGHGQGRLDSRSGLCGQAVRG